MNKSLINKILIVALVGIWSFVGYSFFWPKSTPIDVFEANDLVNAETPVTLKKDAFILAPLERDPFLNSIKRPVKKANNIPKDRQKSIPKNTKTIWPNIAYFGFVKSNDQLAPLVLLKINNKLKRLRQGEVYDQLTVQKVFRDSIVVRMGKETQTFSKN